MKRLIAFIWLCIYMGLSTGFAVSTHYCMDRERSVELGAKQEDRCAKCGMVKRESNGCCRDEIKLVKLQQDTQLAKLMPAAPALAMPVIQVPDHLLFVALPPTTAFVTSHHIPPLLPDRCVANCVFRI